MSGLAVAAGLGALGAAAGAPPVRFTDSSTVKFSSRSLAASRLAVSASLNAPTCTQYGPLAAVAGLGVVAGVAARLGAGVALAATVGLASSFVGGVAGVGFAVSTLATVSGLAAGAGVAGSGLAAGLDGVLSVTAIALLLFVSGALAVAFGSGFGAADFGSTGRAVGGGTEGVTGAGISVESFLSGADDGAGVAGVATGALDATAGFEGGGFIQSSTE